ncbi:MAG: glycosyltransferase family protein [Methanobacteriaceae archaeon]|nr:glycosyltransferase family protein [Methanobacteriaceae archaeon]
MKIGAIIQARLSSTRFSEKVLRKLPYNSDITVLEQVIRRVKKSKLIDEIVIATTTNEEDLKIVEVARKEDVSYSRGSLSNVLERYYNAAVSNDLDIIIRITSDCPCIDFEIIDDVIKNHLDSNADYTSNSFDESFIHGVDVEVINFAALEKSFKEAIHSYEREHVTPFIYKSNPNQFIINSYINKKINNENIRITLDTAKDYALLCSIYDYLYEKDEYFSLNDIINLFNEKPWLKLINEDIIQKKIYNSLDEELEEAIRILDMQDLNYTKEFIEKQL